MTRTELEAALRRELTFTGLKSPDFAVLIPMVWREDGIELLVEVRAEGIAQAGDPCFPGGRIEAGETPALAAVREMQEELGIQVEPERVLGMLPTVPTDLGQRTDVLVCTVSEEEAAGVCPNRAEVAELLRVPMAYFLEKPDAKRYPFGGHDIWGLTAGAIRLLCGVLLRLDGGPAG